MPTIQTSLVCVCIPASNPGANLVNVPCAPLSGSPQIRAMDGPEGPLALSVNFASAEETKMTFFAWAFFCPCISPIDHAIVSAAATPISNSDLRISPPDELFEIGQRGLYNAEEKDHTRRLLPKLQTTGQYDYGYANMLDHPSYHFQ